MKERKSSKAMDFIETNTDIPVYLNNTHGTISSIEISRDNNGKYYVNIDTLKRYYATGIKTTNLKSKEIEL